MTISLHGRITLTYLSVAHAILTAAGIEVAVASAEASVATRISGSAGFKKCILSGRTV